MTIELREIPGIDARYRATADGQIVSYMGKSPKVLAPGGDKCGRNYLTVSVLQTSGRRRNYEVHALVCAAFHGPRPDGFDASHVNGNSMDNRAANLKWEPHRDNLARRNQHGTHDRGLQNSRARLNPDHLKLIHQQRQAGQTHQSIAEQIGVSRTTVSRVLNGQRYAE